MSDEQPAGTENALVAQGLAKYAVEIASHSETRFCENAQREETTAHEILRRARSQHQDRFDDNNAYVSNLLTEKNRLHKGCTDSRTDANETAFFRYSRLVQQRLQDAWMTREVEEIQRYVDRNEIKNLFNTIYDPCTKATTSVLNSDSTTLLIEITNSGALGQALYRCSQPLINHL
ncbi:unnamed protein product [Schistocephalus solidus]|uniref:Uncharacterized protein n=1 Tax=Schistocephalus solidus TaxID=70667 RepID=A0A183SZ50_SCHSO|nr:unnamed protein product [Schistocephalus solidus]